MTIAVVILLAALIGWAIWFTVRRSKKGGGCCGEHEAAEQKVAVADRNRSHYPYRLTLSIGGMTCDNCARRVENALNRLDGVWAKVDFSHATADVRCKAQPDEQLLREAVRQAGYVVLSCTETT